VKKSRFQNYLAGLSTGAVRMLIQVLVGIWLTPFTLRYLDREQFAIFSIALDLLTWLTLLDIGISAGLRVQAARLTGATNQEKINRLASTAFLAQNVIVTLMLVAGFGLALIFPQFAGVRMDLRHEASILMGICVLGVALQIGSQTFSALLVANQQVHVDNLLSLLMIAIRTVITVVLLKLDWGVYSLAIAHLVAKGTTATFAVIRTYRLLPGLKIKYQLASWNVFRQIGRLGIWMSLGGLAVLVIHSLDNIIAAKVISVETVTSLVLTGRFYELAGSLVWLLSESASPMLGQMLGQNKIAESLKAYRQLFALSTGLGVVAALSIWTGNASFISQWVGSVNYGGKWVDLAMALMMIAGLWITPSQMVLSANLSARGPSLVRLVEGAINIGLSILLGKFFGLVGIVLGTLLACAVTSFWIFPLFTSRMFDRPFGNFLRDDARRVFLVAALLLPIAVMARQAVGEISGYFGAAIGASITGVIGLGLVWFMMVDKSLRARLSVRDFYEKACAGTLKGFIGSFTR
jgi:Na+-driven multidrug efflux pump